ncbi:proline-rich protein PRCC isoform X2 [Falco rusticolus]|uniref:proline-rich protein PRCC isoform X2 n=1 Tax=Falco rusticolus TaxID=120794 RepID=UPI0018869760|nr:proline-rich protein PRCC isoform X2 [Falco rusticolus]
MSLVAYASSEEESDAEEAGGEEEEAAAPPDEAAQQPPARGLFATLPPPKAPVMPPLPPPHQPLGSGFPLLPPPHGGPPPPFLMGPPPGMRGFSTPPPAMSPGQAAAVSLPEPAASGNGSGEQPRLGGLLLPPPRNAATTTAASTLSLPPPVSASPALPGAGVDLSLPKPKKRTEPVRITAPELHKGDSDSEEDEPAKKKNTLQGRGEGSGLSALLPQPKNLTVKETNRLLLPYAFSRKAGENASDSKPAKAPTSSSKTKPLSKPAVPTTPSPSAIKAAAKSAALQVTKQITQEDDDSDEEVEPENYFSLSDRSEPSLVGAEAYMYSGTVVSEDPPPGTETEPQFQDAAANAPLEFKTGAGSSGAQHSWAPKPGEDYGSQTYSQFPAYSEAGMAGAYYQFKRLQGKRNRGREEINFVDIKGDDQLSGAQQWLTKSLTEEKTMKSFSKKKGDQPTGQQRRKHQITYLIHQAKERELELKNTWSENKLSRRQTQAKYGF